MEQLPCDPAFRCTDRCEVYRKIGRCFMDVHHLYYPRREYKSSTAQAFRNLDENKVSTCRNLHNIEHAVCEPPTKPDMELMRFAILEERNRRLGAANDGNSA